MDVSFEAIILKLENGKKSSTLLSDHIKTRRVIIRLYTYGTR